MSSMWTTTTENMSDEITTVESSNDSFSNSTLPETLSSSLSTLPYTTKEPNSRHPSCFPRHTNLDLLMRPPTWTERLNLARLRYVTFANILRSISITFCIFWFIFVATLTFQDYLHHDTIVYLNFQSPNTSLPPAITICSHNILSEFSRKTLKNISAWSVLTEDDPLERPHNMPNIDLACVFVPDVTKPNFDEVLHSCEEYVPAVISMQEGHRCYTYFSDIYGQTTRNMRKKKELVLKFDRQPVIQLLINGSYVFGVSVSSNVPSENRSRNEPFTAFSGMYIALHDNTILPDMLGLGFHQLKPQHIVNIPFSKRIQMLIQPPYSDCKKYNLLESNFSTGNMSSKKYRTRGECFLHCQWEILNKDQPCVNYYSIYTKEIIQKENSLRITKNLLKMLNDSQDFLNSSIESNIDFSIKVCPWNESSYYHYAYSKQKCLKNCPVSCTEITFDEALVAEVPNVYLPAIATVTWAPLPVVQIENKKKWDTFADFSGVLGGQLHVWLGFSIVTAICWFLAAIKLRTNSNF